MKSSTAVLGLVGLATLTLASPVAESSGQSPNPLSESELLKHDCAPDCPTQCTNSYNACYEGCCLVLASPCTGDEHDPNTANCRLDCLQLNCNLNGCGCGCSAYPGGCIETAPPKRRSIPAAASAEGSEKGDGAVMDLARRGEDEAYKVDLARREEDDDTYKIDLARRESEDDTHKIDIARHAAGDTNTLTRRVDCSTLCTNGYLWCYNTCCGEYASKCEGDASVQDLNHCQSFCTNALCQPGGCGLGCTGDPDVCSQQKAKRGFLSLA